MAILLTLLLISPRTKNLHHFVISVTKRPPTITSPTSASLFINSTSRVALVVGTLTVSGRSLPHARVFWTVFALGGCVSSSNLINWSPPWEQGLANVKLVWVCSVLLSECSGQDLGRFWAFALKDRTERFCDLLSLTSGLRRVQHL